MDGAWSYFTEDEGLQSGKGGIYDLAFDGSGSPWGNYHGTRYFLNFKDGRWFNLGKENKMPDLGGVHIVELEPGGGVWFGTISDGVSRPTPQIGHG